MAWAPYPVHARTGGVSAPFTPAPQPSKRAVQCGRGGTGRRTGFRFQRRKAWGFESPRPHHRLTRQGCSAIQACNPGAMQILLALGLVLAHPSAIDGDTLRDDQGERYRVENIDAPERGRRSECAQERVLAEAAAAYVTAWIAEARRVDAIPTGRRDRYGRIIARIEIDGVDLGERLIARGLAQPWRGRKANFCSGAWLLPTAR